MKLNHLHISVPSVPKSRAFFEDFFGMKFAFGHGDGVFLKDDAGFLLAIDCTENGEDVELPKWFHYGFCVESAAKVKEIYEKMKSAGVEMKYDYKEYDDSAAVFYCWSPGPLLLEVSWHKD